MIVRPAPSPPCTWMGVPLTTVETTGKGEVVLELFEDQAPAAVANFISLVTAKTYDGTRFYLSEAASLVAGGDPKSKTGDPSEDGTGGPGYFIPDEFKRADARGHFRGSIGMINNGLALKSISSFYQPVVTGIILIVAIVLDELRRRVSPKA